MLGPDARYGVKTPPKSTSAGGPPRTSLGELTALHQTLSLVGRGLAGPHEEPYPASALEASMLRTSQIPLR